MGFDGDANSNHDAYGNVTNSFASAGATRRTASTIVAVHTTPGRSLHSMGRRRIAGPRREHGDERDQRGHHQQVHHHASLAVLGRDRLLDDEPRHDHGEHETPPHLASRRAEAEEEERSEPDEGEPLRSSFRDAPGSTTIASADAKKSAPSTERIVVAAHSSMCPRIRWFVEMPIAYRHTPTPYGPAAWPRVRAPRRRACAFFVAARVTTILEPCERRSGRDRAGSSRARSPTRPS